MTAASKEDGGGAYPSLPSTRLARNKSQFKKKDPQSNDWRLVHMADKDMEPAFIQRLRTSAIDDYRRSYRKFRVGKAHGANGEGPGGEKEDLTDDEDEEGDVHDTVLESENAELYEKVAAFRRHYRRYRMGGAKGTKFDTWELAYVITLEEAKTTPVAQLSAFLRERVAPSLGPRHIVSSISFAHRTTFHCHIGAGKLGLGLVVPSIIRSNTPFAILQRPSGEYNPISYSPSRDPKVDLIVNGETIGKDMLVVRDLSELPPSSPHLSNLFVPSDDPLLLHLLITTATSFSIALGPVMLKAVVPLLSKLPIVPAEDIRPCLYAAENDHKMVRELAKALEGRVDVHELMVDRICVDRKVSADKIEVTAEPFEGEMVILKRPKYIKDNPVPFAGEHVRLPLMVAQANYFCRRKILMVNGTHTTLAFITLCLRQPKQSPKEKETTPEDHELVCWDKDVCGEKYEKDIWGWAVARLLILLWEHDLDLIRHAHEAKTDEELIDQLLEYTTNTLKRFSSIKDTTKRVLSGGVANRWQGRLNDVCVFLGDYRPSPIGSLLLKKAQVKLPYIKKVTEELSQESYRFTGLGTLSPPKKGKVVCT